MGPRAGGESREGWRVNLETLFKLGCGMYIVSTAHEGRKAGQLVNALVQVTAEPVRIVMSLNKQNLTRELLERSGVFSVSVLGRDAPMEFLGKWGFRTGREVDKFSGTGHITGKNGAPVVTDHAVAYLEGRVVGTLDAGTHILFLGEVTEAETLSEAEPMSYAYYREVKKGLTSRLAATYQAKR